jgi:AGCS family alanine or glycine:cation symporter
MMILACQTYNIIGSVQTSAVGESTVTYLQQNPAAPDGEPGVFYTIGAISTLLGQRAAANLVSIALFFFAFTTIMAYYYYAETNLIYLFSRFRRWHLRRMRQKEQNSKTLEQAEEAVDRADEIFGDDRSEKIAVWVLRVCTITAVFVGSMTSSGITWTLGDIGVGAMAWINLVAILLLSPKALRALLDYEKAKKRGEEPHFDPKELDIQGAEFWEERGN